MVVALLALLTRRGLLALRIPARFIAARLVAARLRLHMLRLGLGLKAA